LINNIAIGNLIRSDQNQQIKSFLENSRSEGMFTLEYYLSELVKKGQIEWEEAKKYALNPDSLKALIKSS
jgi:Tfp pilus assembly pilus retraction ATPase PilT